MWPFKKKIPLPDSIKEFNQRFEYICKREGVKACYIAVVPEEKQLMTGGDLDLREIVAQQFEKPR